MQIAIRIEKALIAGAKPSIHKRAGIRFRIVLVSSKHIRTLDGNLAALFGAEMIAVLIHDADAQASADSYRTWLAMPWRQRIRGHLMRRFGHAVGLHKRHAKQIFDLANQLL